MLRPSLIIVTLTCVLPTCAIAQSLSGHGLDDADAWRLCPASGLLPILEPVTNRPADGQIVLNADTIESQNDTVSRLSGNVSIVGEHDLIHADRAVYYIPRQEMELHGNVHYRSEPIEFNAESMISTAAGENITATNVDFFIPVNHGNGSATSIHRQGEEITFLENMTYTTCQPGERLWHFQARDMKLDHTKGAGLAKHMTLRVKDVPVLYFPVLSFPIDERRKSGFLYPTLGDSSRHGTELELPYYWNIAPQADATLTPHYMQERGTKLNTEWRYLNSLSNNKIEYQFLNDDLYGDRRYRVTLNHSGRLGRRWSTALNAAEVSDIDYLRDFGTGLNSTTTTHLPQSATLTGQWDNWSLVTRLLSYQTVDESIAANSEPDSIKPEVSLGGYYPDIGFNIEFELESSYAIFEHNDNSSDQRFDFWPRFSRSFGNNGWFVVPAVSGRFTSYRFDNTDPLAEQEDEIRRSIPTASLESGLIFERTLAENDRFLQTFEPRIFYLKTPFRDQQDIPVFDTSLPEFGMYQLYEENRFAGIDRIGDADQLSISMTGRWLQRDTGAERLRISLGQIRFYEDRKVTLPNRESETDKQSGILAEIAARFADYWDSSLDLEWNPDTEKTDKGLFRLRYNRQNRYILNLGYRYRRAASTSQEALEQADVSFNLPVDDNWSVIGRWNHSIENRLDLDKYFGFEYESCCWAFRILGREFLLDQDTVTGLPQFDKSIYIEIVFKGLTRSGGNIGQRLEDNIPGYKDPFE